VALIETRGLTKVFRQPVKDPGLKGSLKHLATRNFKDRVAVDDVDLTIEAGEAIAYVGPNGAGKSTTIKMLTGILVPTSGEIRVAGLVPHKQRMDNARNIGVVFGQRTQLWWDIPVRESLALLKEIYKVPRDRYEQTLRDFDELLDLDEIMGQIGRRLSLGQRMRGDLAASLLHNPKILYLDEPTIGLDIEVKDRVRAFIRKIVAERGTTVLLTTHDLGDIEDICKRLVIIDEGRVIYDGDLQAVKDTYARERSITFVVRGAPPLAAVAARLADCTVEAGEGADQIVVRFDRFDTTAGDVVGAVLEAGDLVDFHIDEPAIEDVIRKVYAGRLDLTTGTTAR
jgi:ABC-2 type transport system ATP-binding protein